MTKKTFYFLSFTWGLLYTTAGLFIALIMLLTGHKPKKWGWSWYFETGKKPWGGAEWGLIFLKDKYSGDSLKNHEISEKLGKKPSKPYDDIWFEKQATELGIRQMKKLKLESVENHHI